VDLMVPADASIVIEGYVSTTRTAQDGPSPGPTMLFTPYASQQPVFEVTAIMTRRQPIYRHHRMTPFTDHQEMPRLFHGGDPLRAAASHGACGARRSFSAGRRVAERDHPSGAGGVPGQDFRGANLICEDSNAKHDRNLR